MRSLLSLVTLVATLTAGSALIACRRAPPQAFVAHGPLPAPPPGPLEYAGRAPEHPFHRERGNVYLRTVFTTSGPSSSRIEIRDILVPPHAKGELDPLSGPALVEVYPGAGKIGLGKAGEFLSPGTMNSVAKGQVIKFENPGARPVIMRLYLIEAK